MYLGPIADAIAKQMGGPCTISVVGPIPEAQGDVQLRSVHANWKGSLDSFTWPKYDPIGYAAAQKSIVGFGRAVFSERVHIFLVNLPADHVNIAQDECARRALPATKPEDPINNSSLETMAERPDQETFRRPGPVLDPAVAPPGPVLPSVTTSVALVAPDSTTPLTDLQPVPYVVPEPKQSEDDSDDVFATWDLHRHRSKPPTPDDSWELPVGESFREDSPGSVGNWAMPDFLESDDPQQQRYVP